MLHPLEDMPDESEINVFAASRELTWDEQQEIVQIHINWLHDWSARNPARMASECSVILERWVVAWAVTEYRQYPLLHDTDLHALFANLDGVFASLKPPAMWTHGFALLYDKRAYSTPDDWKELIVTQKITPATIGAIEIVAGGKLAEMPERACRHVLKRDRDYDSYRAIIQQIANESGIPWI